MGKTWSVSDLVVSRVAYVFCDITLCYINAHAHFRAIYVTTLLRVITYRSFCFSNSIIVTSPSVESGRVLCQARKKLNIHHETEAFRDGIWYRGISKGTWHTLKCILCKCVHYNTSYLIKLFLPGIWGWLALVMENEIRVSTSVRSFLLIIICEIVVFKYDM